MESQRRAAIAIEEGRFDKGLVPVLNEDGTVALDREEFPRPGTTLESLASLPSSFEKLADLPLAQESDPYRSMLLTKSPDLVLDFVHPMGNASAVVARASAILVTRLAYQTDNGLTPLAARKSVL